MADTRDPQADKLPQAPDADVRPRIGTDEWVAQVEGRRERYAGPLGQVRRAWDAVPPAARLGAFLVAAAVFPFLTDSEYVKRVGVDTLIYVLLAVGLNVVVGYAGLLDLGYIAFFGFGAYCYAFMSSNQFDIHWPAQITVPLIVFGSALLGLVLGLPSRRLLGDYLAIVTLFFGQLFVTVSNNANRITPPWRDTPIDVTGGPNGITNLDEFDVFGLEIASVEGFFYLSLAVFVIVVVAIHFVNESRTGRAWRAVREDPLAAEVMSMPVNRLKLLAFMFGAAVAGLTGTVFAALQTSVFPNNFDLPLLITVYAMVILGGAGSLAGVALGAIVINVLLEVLTSPSQARVVFYGAIALGLVALVRPWRSLAAVAVGTIALGFAVHAIVAATWERGTAGEARGGGFFARVLDEWIVLPGDARQIANYGFALLIASVLVLTLIKRPWRWVALPPVLYLAAFVWENRLIREPSVTRLILLGAILVALMHARPQGLLGTPRVEIV